MLDALTLTLFWLTAASWLARAQNVLWSMDNAWATYYYDDLASSDGDPCHEAADGIKDGTTMCQWYMSKGEAPLISALGTNRFVAVNRNLLAANMWLCGKKVRITQPDGTVYDNSEGDLFIWDGCQAAETQSIVDLSATTFAAISGDSSCSMGNYPGKNPASGLKVEVLDEYVWNPPCDDSWTTSNAPSYSDTNCLCHVGTVAPPVASESINPPAIGACDASGGNNASSGFSTSLAPTSPLATSLSTVSASTTVYQQPSLSTPPGSTASQSLPAGVFHEYYNDPNGNTTSGGNCTFGAWQCDGNDLQVCGMTTGQLAWYTAQSCTTSCTITSSGSVICE